MAGISDLLEALKRTETNMKKGMDLGKPKGEISITMIGAKKPDAKPDAMPEEEMLPEMEAPTDHHAAMVDALKEHFPEVHAELIKKVGGGNDGFNH